MTEAGEFLDGATIVGGTFADDFLFAGDQRAGHAHGFDAFLVFQGHQAQRRQVDSVSHAGHGLYRLVGLAAVGRAEQGGPGASDAPRGVELVVMDEARVVLQQHGEGHFFAIVLAGETDGPAQLFRLHHEDFGQALLAEQLQIEVLRFLDHHLELGIHRLTVFVFELRDFMLAEHMALAARNAPLHVQDDVAVAQLDHIAQLVLDLVDDVDGARRKIVEA